MQFRALCDTSSYEFIYPLHLCPVTAAGTISLGHVLHLHFPRSWWVRGTVPHWLSCASLFTKVWTCPIPAFGLDPPSATNQVPFRDPQICFSPSQRPISPYYLIFQITSSSYVPSLVSITRDKALSVVCMISMGEPEDPSWRTSGGSMAWQA